MYCPVSLHPRPELRSKPQGYIPLTLLLCISYDEAVGTIQDAYSIKKQVT